VPLIPVLMPRTVGSHALNNREVRDPERVSCGAPELPRAPMLVARQPQPGDPDRGPRGRVGPCQGAQNRHYRSVCRHFGNERGTAIAIVSIRHNLAVMGYRKGIQSRHLS
jgi:hypothetical protein